MISTTETDNNLPQCFIETACELYDDEVEATFRAKIWGLVSVKVPNKDKKWIRATISWSLLAGLLYSQPIWADDQYARPKNIQALYEECKSNDVLQQSVCAAYIDGEASMMEIIRPAMADSKFTDAQRGAVFVFSICGDEKVSIDQMKHIFINWAERHRDLWWVDANMGVWRFMAENFACTTP
jgi:hypothetical protein